MAKKLIIVGCGPGGADHVTEAARAAVRQADTLFGAPRLLALFIDVKAQIIPLRKWRKWDGWLLARIRRETPRRNAAVLVSGDPGFSSFAMRLIAAFGRKRCRIIPGLSSLQVACARVGVAWENARIVNAHGRAPAVNVAELASAPVIAVLLGNARAVAEAQRLAASLDSRTAWLCENLTLPEERVRRVRLSGLQPAAVASLAILLLVKKS